MKFLATLLLLISFQAMGQSKACEQDTKKFCNGTDPGRGQLAQCLGDYQGQLSPACAKELKEFKTKTLAKNPCFDELAEFCVDIPSDNRKLEYCLMKNETKLGAKCGADFKKKKPNIIVKDVCAQDIVNTCYSTLSESEAATTKCLIKNTAKLSGFCKKKTEARIADMRKKNPCFDETEKYCPNAVQFVDIQICLEKKGAALTPACKKVVDIEVAKSKANPCYVDLRKHCKPGIAPSDQYRCLQLNEKELSNSCRQYRTLEADKLNKMADVCEKDRLKLCPKAPFQNGMILKCLKENKAKVTPACQALL